MLIPLTILIVSVIIFGIVGFNWPLKERYQNLFGATGDANQKVKQSISHYKKEFHV